MENKLGTSWVIGIIVGLVVGGVAGYWYGGKAGYDKGYAKAGTDIVKIEDEVAKKATEEATKAANPFEIGNPLQDVETAPLSQLKKTLNPFE